MTVHRMTFDKSGSGANQPQVNKDLPYANQNNDFLSIDTLGRTLLSGDLLKVNIIDPLRDTVSISDGESRVFTISKGQELDGRNRKNETMLNDNDMTNINNSHTLDEIKRSKDDSSKGAALNTDSDSNDNAARKTRIKTDTDLDFDNRPITYDIDMETNNGKTSNGSNISNKSKDNRIYDVNSTVSRDTGAENDVIGKVGMSTDSYANNKSTAEEVYNFDYDSNSASNKTPDMAKDETDSGVSCHSSLSSSTNNQPLKNDNIIITVLDEEIDDEPNNSITEDIVNDMIGFLKADDKFNRARRLTGDSGIDDDYSSISSDEDGNGDKKRKRTSLKNGTLDNCDSTKNKHRHNFDSTNMNKDPSSAFGDVFSNDECTEEIETLECIISTSIQGEKVDCVVSLLNSRDFPQQKTEISMTNQSSLQASQSDQKDTRIYEDISDQIAKINNIETFIPVISEPASCFDIVTDDGSTLSNAKEVIMEDNFCHLNELKNTENLVKFTTKEDDKQSKTSLKDDLIKQNRVNSVTGAIKQEADSNNFRETINSATNMVESVNALHLPTIAGTCVESEITAEVGKSNSYKCDQVNGEANNNKDDLISAMAIQKDDPIQKINKDDTDKPGEVIKSFVEKCDFAKQRVSKNAEKDTNKLLQGTEKENNDFSENSDIDDREIFHSDEEDNKILAEILPNIRKQKTPQDETRSNTVSFQSMESWSVYESCDDYTLSESNFDTVSYQNFEDEDFLVLVNDKSGNREGSEKSCDKDKLELRSQNDEVHKKNGKDELQKVPSEDELKSCTSGGTENSFVVNADTIGSSSIQDKPSNGQITEFKDRQNYLADNMGLQSESETSQQCDENIEKLIVNECTRMIDHKYDDLKDIDDEKGHDVVATRSAENRDKHFEKSLEDIQEKLVLKENIIEELKKRVKSAMEEGDQNEIDFDNSTLGSTDGYMGLPNHNKDNVYYSTDEYVDDESDVSVEEIEEEKSDILRKLDLSSFVIDDSSRHKQLAMLEEISSPDSSDSAKNEISKTSVRTDSVDSINEKKTDLNACREDKNTKTNLMKLKHLHVLNAFDEFSDESHDLTNISDTKAALPNTLFIGDKEFMASIIDRVAAKTGSQFYSPPESEEGEFDEFVNLSTVGPEKEPRVLLSPIVEEGTLSRTNESTETVCISSPEEIGKDITPKKKKRPSLIDLLVTDTNGVVEQIDIEKIDTLQSFAKPRRISSETKQEGIPRILKGPSTVTAMDGAEIILQWTIVSQQDPDVVIFKDGDTLELCDGITLDKDGDTWTLRIPYAIKEDAGLYEICAVNASGNDILKTRVYVKTVNRPTVNEDIIKKTIREQGTTGVPDFVKVPKDQQVTEGEIIHVECQILGHPCPQIVWLKDGEPFYPDDRMEILQNDASCQLLIKEAVLEDSGTYTCRASNSLGVNQVQFSVTVSADDNDKNVVDTEAITEGHGQEAPKWNWKSGYDQDKPMAPVVQLDMSESDECFSLRYQVLVNYHDDFNDVDLIEGELTELLDRSKESHWLVKSLEDESKICYVPPYLLESTNDGTEHAPRWNPHILDTPEEIKNKTRKVLSELLESETDYICDLKDLLDTYNSPVKEEKIVQESSTDKQSRILDSLSQLYQFHKETLLPSLLLRSQDPESVGEIFTEKRGSFSEYVPFCSEHDKALDFTDMDQMQALMEAFSLLSDPDSAFEDLLNRPLERIHEYIDILKTLIKLTAQSGGDCSGLMAAVQMLSEICRNMEDIVLLDRIQGYHGDVKELGPVLKHENVIKIEEDKDEELEAQRHVILFPDKIMITKPMTSDPKGKLEFEKIIQLKDVTVGKQDETDGSYTIELWEDKSSELTVSPSLKLQVQDIHTKQAWVRDIQEAKKKLELQNSLSDTMPEFRQKLKGKKLTSTPKKKVVKNVDTVELESDRSSDDFNILDTRKDLVGDRYIAAEFEDGTTRPLFKRKLQKTIVGENSTARLECEVAGIPQPKVLWLKNNRPLFESDHCKVITDGAIHALEFTDTRREDTGLYTARAMNVNGSTISTTEFYVGEVQPSLLNKYKEGLSDAKYQTPAYFFQMNSCQVEEGRLARFDCRVVAYPKPDIVWMKDGKIVEPNDRYKLLNFNNEIYSLLIQNVVKDDMGRYTCWAHNKYGEAMTEAYLNVIAFHDQQDEGDMAPQFLTRFYDQTLTEGVPAELQCLIDGRPMPTIKWLFNDIEIIPNDNIALLQEKNLCSLCIKQVTPKDLGTYTCNLKNPLGEASCSAGLNVLSEKIKNVPVLPKFLKRITDQNMRTGEGVTFEVVVIGEPPPKVSWLFNHKPISESRRRFTISQDGDVYRLSIEDLILDDDGKITCKAVNSEGEVYCSGNLLVRESRKAQEQPDEPKFTQKDFDAKYGYLPTFLKKIDDISVPSGKDGKFECRIMGIPEPTITWLKDSKPLTNDGRHWISQDGGNCYLTVRGVTDKDQGCYTCTIANAAGESSCTGYMRLSEAKKSGEYFERESSLTPGRRGSQGRGEVPTMPYEKPTISDVRPESMRLTWQPVLTSALSSDSKNVKYIIEGRELPDAEWRKMASGIHGNTYLLRNLRPQRDYDFRVRAENQFGLSDATQPATIERPRPEIEELSESMKSKVPSFRRPPELPRSKPHIADMGTESLKLAWQPAVLPPVIKKPPPVTYRLEAQELPATDWLPLTSRLTDTSHYLTDLLPDRDYNIRVRAENQYGLSEPTESIWIPRAKAYPGVPIARPEIIEMEPNMVKLRWERVDVPSFSADDENLRYMIEMQAPPARDWSTVGRDIAGTVYVVSDLEPGQDYRFRVRARTPLGVVSEPSPVTSVYRTFATTRAPIDSLELEDEDVDFDGIRLRWNRVQIPPYSAGEEPLLYMIEVNEPPLDEWRPVVSGLPTTRYRVTDLVPDRDYNFRVRALSSYGISPPSYTLPVSYRRPLPGPSRILPEYPQIVYDDSDALQLSWQPPKVSTPLREPIRYRVELQAPPSLTWKPLATGIPETRYPIRGLGPSRDYMFRVVPETTAGLLEPLPPVSLTSLPAPRTFLPSRPEILDYEPDSFMLSWRRPYLDTHLSMMYRIDVQEPPSLDWRPLVSDITDTRYRVTGLRPSRDYSFRIVPYAGTDYWEPLPPVTITSLPVKPRFRPHEPTITPLGSDSVKLSWKPADIPMYPRTPVPIRYIIDMRTLPRYDWIPMARNIADTSYIVKGLIPDKEYQFRVRPQTDYGIGEPTMPATYYRRPVPYVSREPVVSNIYADSVLLSWQPAEFKGDFKFPPNVTYTIEVQDRPGAGPWTPFVSGIQGTNYHVTGLHPDREYFFRVRGHVGDVFGEPSVPVYLPHRAGPPRMPHEQPYISELSPNSVHLQWRAVQLPSRITDYAPVSYRLEIQELPRSDWVILADGIPHTDFHVTNLHPDKEYNFRVRAINKYGCSEPTPLVQIRRRAVPPNMPKDEPLIYDIGHGSLMLSWRPAEVPYYLGDSSVTYTIYVQEPPSMTWRPLYRRIPYTSYHVTNLHPDRDYCFRIQAENMYGLSQPTNTVRLTRLSDFRSPIDIPEITEFDETRSSLQLRWKPRYVAPFDKGPLRYHIESWEPVKRTWRRLAADIPDTSYRLTGLSPENDYILRIRAQAETALSEPSYPISTSKYRGRVPITRPQLYDVDQDSVRLSWQPYPGVTAPRRYHLELRESSSRDWRPVTTDIYGTTHKVTGLKPKQDYQFRLRGITEAGPTDYIYSVPLHRRSVIPRLPLAGVDVVGVEDDYVDLRWRLVDIPAFDYDEKPLAFLIEAQQLPRYDWVPVASGISDTGYRVKGLQRNQDYVFRIRGEYPSGLSQPSQHVSVYRRPSVYSDLLSSSNVRPGVPITHPEIFDEEPTTARLRWQRIYTPPFHNYNEPLTYQIELQEAPYRNWRPLARGITMTEHTITDLMPKKDYLFRIRAETPNGDISAPTPPVAYYKSHLPSPRIPRKIVDYKMFEQDFTVPSRSYVDHLTTFIPPRLPLDKPEMTEDGPSTVTLRWRPALVPERTREKYPVTYSIEVKNPPELEWREIETGLTGLSHTLKNIHPEIDYMFRVRAHNEFGCSESTLPVSLYRPIEIEEYYDPDYDDDFEYPLVTLGDCEAPIEEVPPKLPMETPKLTNVTGERATLHWLPARIPAYAKKVPITYIVEIKEDNMPSFSRFQSGIIDTKFSIEGLNPTQSYQFRVKAETQFGCSDPTLAVVLERNKDKIRSPSIRRDDLDIPQAKIREVLPTGVPPRMSSSRPLITNRYGGNLSLTWGPGRVPSYVKGSTMTYIVEKREPPHTSWTVLADNLTDNEYDVTGLNPERDYMFRVRARNQFGTSDPTMPCSVINVKDDYVPPVFSRSQSRDSGTPRGMSRRSSIESPLSLSRQMSLDENDDMYRTAMPPEFKSAVEEIQYGVLGKTARISLAVRGFPLPIIEWAYKGDNLMNNKKYKSFITPSGVITLDIFNFCLSDVGEYKCQAQNDSGVKSMTVLLEYADAPTFIEPTKDLYLDNHRSGKFECKVDGVPYPTIKWMKDWRPVTESSRLKIQHTKPNIWSLNLSDVISLDSGLYTCIAENMAGKSMCSANLFVDELETTVRPVVFREAVFEDYFYVLEELGRGRHGVVRKVIEKSTGKEYAAKIIPACNEELKYFFGHELNNLRNISNPRVPSVIDAFQSERQLVIVMELIKGRSLLDHILHQDTWFEEDAVFYIKQLLEILRNLHASSIVHLDIKPSNIHMSALDSDEIRLLDFGFSRHLSMDYDIKLNYGTEEFTSPEQINNQPLTTAADMWSVGILTYILLSGVSPLRGDNDSETLKKVLEGKINLSEENFKHVSEDAKDFLAELLVVEPYDRLTAGECLQHPWIKEFSEKSKSGLDLGPLSLFHARDKEQRKLSSLRSTPRLYNLTSVLEQSIPTTPLVSMKDEQTRHMTFPESEYYGEYLDEESWYDWQNRYHKGPGTKVVPLSETDYLARVRGSRPSRRVTDVDMDEDVEVVRKMSVLEADTDIHDDSCLRKELQYVVVADDVKLRKQGSKVAFPKDSTKDENPQIIYKFSDTAFNPGEDIVLSCKLEISETPAVSWYRNEELISESSRISIKITDNGTTLSVLSAKPYDSGIYKCIVRSNGGKTTAAARVLVGDVPSQPSRPVAMQVSSQQVLLLWEPPASNGNSAVLGYRVDYRKTSESSWLTGSECIDECTIISQLVPNTNYRFRVCAVNQFGSSAYSVASAEIKTSQGAAELMEDEYTRIILARQSGVVKKPRSWSTGSVEITEGSFSDKYLMRETLYSGKFSELKIAESISTGKSCGVKVISCDRDQNSAMREFEVVRLMNHDKVIKLYDVFLFSDKLYIFLEYLYGVNVLQHFAFKTKYSEDMVAIVIRQVLEGVQYLQHIGIAHLNLQPSSIVMTTRKNLDLKIVGFRNARKISGNGEVVPIMGYPDFVAPEVVTGEITSYPADIWTVGVLMFLLLSGESPYRDQSVEEIYTNIAYNRYDAHQLYENVTRDALRFINRILKRIPRNRMTVDECLEDKWLQVTDTAVKARQDAVFTAARLRSFAELYRERGILGTWMPKEADFKDEERSVKTESFTTIPTKTSSSEITESQPRTEIQIEKTSQVERETGGSSVLSHQDIVDQVAESVVLEAIEQAFDSEELK